MEGGGQQIERENGLTRIRMRKESGSKTNKRIKKGEIVLKDLKLTSCQYAFARLCLKRIGGGFIIMFGEKQTSPKSKWSGSRPPLRVRVLIFKPACQDSEWNVPLMFLDRTHSK